MGLTKAAITRPIFIFMLVAAAFLLGTISYRGMRLELNPEVSFPVVTVTTAYPGAGPEEINNLVSRKIEESISGINGLREITSSSTEGFSVVVANFEIGTNIDVALSDVRSKVDAAVNSLPQDALKPSISKFDTSATPVLSMAFSANEKMLNSQQLRDLIDEKLVDRFAQIPGVASANVSGGDTREVQVRLRKDKLISYGIGILDVQRQVAAASLNSPAGRIVSGNREFTVRVPAQFETTDQIRNMVLTISDPNNPQGKAKIVKLTDVADVVDTVEERQSYSRLNGRDTITINVQKSRDGNAVQIAAAAEKVIEDIEKAYAPQGIEIIKTFEAADQISDSLKDLNFDLTFAIFLVAAIVFVFLHNLRGTIIVALAIPTCIFATFIALSLFGFSINNMTMLALTLAVGVLVDDAIVVLENIFRHLKMGEDPREAALNGRGEIGLAAIAITMADVVVFLPIATMGGIVGQFFKPMAIAFVCAVLTSLFVSFTLTPMLASRWYRAGEDMEHPTGRFAVWFERMFGKLEHAYRRTLEWALNHRWFVFISGNLSLFAIGMFIAGSFTPADPKKSLFANAMTAGFGGPGAPSPALSLTFMAIFVGFLVFAINYLRNRANKRLTWALVVGSLVAGVVLATLRQMPPMMGIMLGIVVLSLITLVMNIPKPYAKSRILASALAFGLVFPIAAMAGFRYATWKQEAVFKFEFIPQSDGGQVTANVELPPGASLAATERVVKQVEDIMIKDTDVKYTVSNVGFQGGGGFGGGGNSGSNYASVNATLWDKRSLKDRLLRNPERLRDRRDTEVAADMTRRIGRIPGALVTVAASGGNGFGKPIQMSFGGENRKEIEDAVKKIKERLQDGAIAGVINPDISSKPGKVEMQIRPDRTLVADAGTTVQQLALAARMLYQGDENTRLRVNGKEYNIRTMLDYKDRNDPELVKSMPITFNGGRALYLSSFGPIVQEPGVTKISRRDREDEVQLTADLLPGYAAGSVQAQISQWLEKEKLVPAGVRIKPLGQADAQARESGYLFGAIGIGLVLVYMLLASLYDNLLYPFIIQLAQPQAMVGALLALVITNKSLNIVGMIGIITLVGLVGKNAILLVDYTNTLRGRGRNRHDAIVEAGPTRLRPIAMTTLALVLGTMPIALALGRGSEFRETLGISIIGGITLSTILTLVVIPCSYTIFDDLSNWISRKTGRRPSPQGAAELTHGDTESTAHPTSPAEV